MESKKNWHGVYTDEINIGDMVAINTGWNASSYVWGVVHEIDNIRSHFWVVLDGNGRQHHDQNAPFSGERTLYVEEGEIVTHLPPIHSTTEGEIEQLKEQIARLDRILTAVVRQIKGL